MELPVQAMVRMMDAGVRGANPWCGWLRFVLLPAFLAPMWFLPGPAGMLAGMAVMTVWMLLPTAFRKPRSDQAWMVRAGLGTQIWRSRPLEDPAALLLCILVAASLAAGALTLDPQRPVPLLAALIAYALSHLAFLGRAARLYGERTRPTT